MDATERRLPAPPGYRRPLIFTSVVVTLVILVALLFWTARSLQASKLDRWLPERAGSAVILDKLYRGADPILIIRLEVPAASPTEAELIPTRVNGREEMVRARTLDTSVHVDQAQWDAAAVGMRVRALYHINVRRSDTFVPTLYLDAMEQGVEQK